MKKTVKKDPDSLVLREALALHQAGNREKAKLLYESILQRSPDNFDALHLLGVVNLELGNAGEAAKLILKAIALKPAQAEFHCNYGLVLRSMGRITDSIEAFEEAARLNRRYAAPYVNKGVALLDLGHRSDALLSFEKAILIEPTAVAYMNRGLALRDLRRFPEAIQSLELALRLDPTLEEAKVNLGSGYAHFGRIDEALALFGEVIRRNPRSVGALNNRGVVMRDLGRYEEGLSSLNVALKVDPGNIEALSNKGSLLNDLGRFDEAREFFDKVLSKLPTNAAANWGKAISCLSVGDFATGWELYDYRIGYSKLGIFPPKTKKPQWTPEFNGTTVLVVDEQGLGDSVFFASRLRDIEGLAPRVIVRVDDRLLKLFARSFPKLTFIPNSVDIQSIEFDAYLMFGSLFKAIGPKKQLRPPFTPYLAADADNVGRFRNSLRESGKVLCGLSWRSFRKGIGAEKSLDLMKMQSLLTIPGAVFVNLQYGDVDREVEDFFARHGVRIRSMPGVDLTTDIDGVATVIKACDYVISTSNTTAHLAGALGVPGTILVPQGAGRLFYWNNRTDANSYWYPSLKLLDMSFGDDRKDIVDRALLEFREFVVRSKFVRIP